MIDTDLVVAAAGKVPGPRAQRVVVDLTLAMLHDGESVTGLVRTLAAGRPSCLVCDRMTALLLLRRWGISETHSVFGSVGDAMQAWLFQEAGYGPGWTPGDRRSGSQ